MFSLGSRRTLDCQAGADSGDSPHGLQVCRPLQLCLEDKTHNICANCTASESKRWEEKQIKDKKRSKTAHRPLWKTGAWSGENMDH